MTGSQAKYCWDASSGLGYGLATANSTASAISAFTFFSMAAISSLVACLASTSSRMYISSGSQLRYHSRTFSGTPLMSHASDKSVGWVTDGQLVSLPGQRTVCVSINCGPAPRRIFSTASEIVACTMPESRPSICWAGTLYALGKSVNGNAAIVDDCVPVDRFAKGIQSSCPADRRPRFRHGTCHNFRSRTKDSPWRRTTVYRNANRPLARQRNQLAIGHPADRLVACM